MTASNNNMLPKPDSDRFNDIVVVVMVAVMLAVLLLRNYLPMDLREYLGALFVR